MIEPLRRLWPRRGNKRAEQVGTPPPDWRATLRRRVIASTALLGLWAGAIEGRLVYLQLWDRADLVERAFGGSASDLVQRALSQSQASPDELATIRSLIEDLERRGS